MTDTDINKILEVKKEEFKNNINEKIEKMSIAEIEKLLEKYKTIDPYKPIKK